MTRQEMKELIIETIKKERWVPVIDVEELFKKNEYDYEGDRALYSVDENGNPNESIVIWRGWNEDAATIICEILDESNRKIAFKPALNPIEFFCLGGGLTYMDIAKSPTKKYKKQRWLPGAYVWVGDK